MKINLIRHSDNCKRLLLIFSGWSTEPDFYNHIEKEGWDAAVVSDYSDLSLDISFLDNYDTIWVFAWSLGVKMAAVSLPAHRVVAAYAINGTLNPVDDSEGIPKNIYIGTTENLNFRNLAKFQLRMAGSKEVYNRYFGKEYSEQKIDNLKRELDSIRNINCEMNNLPWRRVFFGKNDKIFPLENMNRSWAKQGVDITVWDDPHYIDMMRIIDTVVPDISHIARRFKESSDSYLENAHAQRNIGIRLTSFLENCLRNDGGSVLEIGVGKGLFTREYAPVLKPERIDFVDITQLDKFNIAPEERYFEEDAEDFMSKCDSETYNWILSSSAVQWFSNFRMFVENSYRLLSRGGVLCFSTFAKGNLKELDVFRPSPLHYFSTDEIKEIVGEYFEEVEVSEDTIKLEFDTSRDLLMHLKLTGVGGSAPSTGLSPLKLRNTKSLTFRPVYVLARKN